MLIDFAISSSSQQCAHCSAAPHQTAAVISELHLCSSSLPVHLTIANSVTVEIEYYTRELSFNLFPLPFRTVCTRCSCSTTVLSNDLPAYASRTRYTPYHPLHTASALSTLRTSRSPVPCLSLRTPLTGLFFSSISKTSCLHSARGDFPLTASSLSLSILTASHLTVPLACAAPFSRTKTPGLRPPTRLLIQKQPCRFPLWTRYTSPSLRFNSVLSFCHFRSLSARSLSFFIVASAPG